MIFYWIFKWFKTKQKAIDPKVKILTSKVEIVMRGRWGGRYRGCMWVKAIGHFLHTTQLISNFFNLHYKPRYIRSYFGEPTFLSRSLFVLRCFARVLFSFEPFQINFASNNPY